MSVVKYYLSKQDTYLFNELLELMCKQVNMKKMSLF